MGKIVRSCLKAVDTTNLWVGLVCRWFVVILVAVGVYDVIARYVFKAPTVWAYETMCMLGFSIVVFGWGYAQLKQAHVRVDVFYSRLSPRRRAIIDVFGTALLAFPLFIIYIKTAIEEVWRSWQSGEVMMETFWYPPAVPIRIVFVIGCCFVFIQFVAQFIRDLYILVKGQPL